MNCTIIMTACAALIEERDNANATRSALEDLIQTAAQTLPPQTPEHANILVQKILAVVQKYHKNGGQPHWSAPKPRWDKIPALVASAHHVWKRDMRQRMADGGAQWLPILLELSHRLPQHSAEARVFLHDVVHDAMFHRGIDPHCYEHVASANTRLWNHIGELSSKSEQPDFAALYTAYLRQSPNMEHWISERKRVYVFPQSLEFLLNEKRYLCKDLLNAVAQSLCVWGVSKDSFAQSLIAHATQTNEDIQSLVENHWTSPTVMEVFRNSDLRVRFSKGPEWTVEQLHQLHGLEECKWTSTELKNHWNNTPPDTQTHALTLALCGRMKSHVVKTCLEDLLSAPHSLSLDTVVEKCLADAVSLPSHRTRILRGLSEGLVWGLLPPTARRAVLDGVTTAWNSLSSTDTVDAKLVGVHVHIVFRALNEVGFITEEDATLAKDILLRAPHINSKTQLLNMVKLSEQGVVEVAAEEVDQIQVQLADQNTAELLLLAAASTRPQAATLSKRRM